MFVRALKWRPTEPRRAFQVSKSTETACLSISDRSDYLVLVNKHVYSEQKIKGKTYLTTTNTCKKLHGFLNVSIV